MYCLNWTLGAELAVSALLGCFFDSLASGHCVQNLVHLLVIFTPVASALRFMAVLSLNVYVPESLVERL